MKQKFKFLLQSSLNAVKKRIGMFLSHFRGTDSSVLFDMFAKHWSIHRDQHHDSPLIVIYANTSNEFASMPSHVRSFCKYIEQKYNIQSDIESYLERGMETAEYR